MYNFTYTKINSKDELLRVLDEKKGRIWAGGTDLMLKLKHGMVRPQSVFDISNVKEFCSISENEDYIHIGSCVKLSALLKNVLIKESAPLLAKFAGEIGSMEIRNVGTVGGNICASRANCGICFLPGCRAMTGDNAAQACRNSSYADLLLPLIAYNASVVIISRAGERRVAVKDFFKGSGFIDLKPNEVLAEVLLRKVKGKSWGVAELRQPVKMGFPYISVIAKRNGNVYDLTIGGSTKQVYTLNSVHQAGVEDLCINVKFVNTLKLSEKYRKETLSAVIREAINSSGQGYGYDNYKN